MKLKFLITLVAGLLLPLAFAPFHFFVLGIISPALLLLILVRSTPKQSFWYGGLFGLGFFGIGISWVYISIHRFGHAPLAASIAITTILIIVMSLFIAVQCYLARKLAKNTTVLCLLSFPIMWVIFECLRTYIPFGGFPWLLLGYSQTTLTLSGYAPLFGVYFISLSLVFTAGVLALFASARTSKLLIGMGFLVVAIWLVGDLLQHAHWTQAFGNPIKVSLIQGNVPQSLKWNPAEAQHTLKMYRRLTKANLSSQLIVWPEAAIPEYPQNIPFYLGQLNTLAIDSHTNILAGAPIYHDRTNHAFNGLISLGDAKGTYLKRHLVPFGEYFPAHDLLAPLMKYLQIPMSGFTPGPMAQPLLQVHIGKETILVSPFICYEIVFPNLVLESTRNANLLMTISDDSWFGNSIARAQHLQMAQMESQILGRSQIFSSNNGITALINASGEITKTIPKDKVAVLTGMIQPMKGKTPLMTWGY